jgi:rRNA maturation protein Nop10
MMRLKREVGPTLGHPPEYSNRPTPFPGSASQRMIPRRFSGWDPYEVWRTRVKEWRDPAPGETFDSAG